jgi:hypothetical protein
LYSNVDFDSPPPRYGTSPIWIASSEGHVSCVEALLHANADVLHVNKCVLICDLLRIFFSLFNSLCINSVCVPAETADHPSMLLLIKATHLV